MTKSQRTLIEEFRNGAMHGQASHMYIDDHVLYSYGRHFPLAVRYDAPGEYRFLVNGDRYSITTSCQQRRVFNLGPQIPFSALDAAGVAARSLEIIDRREDAYHEVPDPTPEDPEHKRTEHTLGAVLFSHEGRFLLSSMDENEPWGMRSYFLCQLPKEVTSIVEAYDSLVPDRVKEWRSSPANPKDARQGEWFFLPTEYETRDLPRPTYRDARLGDTTHYVTEMRRNADPHVRGFVRHRPSGRRAQHHPLRLGDAWHIALKNLAVASWNAVGQVD